MIQKCKRCQQTLCCGPNKVFAAGEIAGRSGRNFGQIDTAENERVEWRR